MVSNIVKGHKGVMDLDLDLVPKEYWKEAIKQHEQDIKEYNMDQDKLPERLRYENTILRIKKLHETDNEAATKRNEIKMDEEEKRMNIYNKKK
tara:strand:+ start:665 stop:943 length:279 start_codon:yes stop_codon:yes gene_type:complete